MTSTLRTAALVSSWSFRLSSFVSKAMSVDSKSSSTHLDRTEASPQQEVISAATVTEINQLSQTVKTLSFKVEDSKLTFKPGQWVDFFIPGVPTVGGFSLCSSPTTLEKDKTVKLAVKHSDHPPALWVHTKCSVGSKVHMRVGGNIYFDPQPGDSSPDLLLVAGGVGINPLYSIVQHLTDLIGDPQRKYSGNTLLLFSAKNHDELLFKDSLLQISTRFPSIRCKFFVTKPEIGNIISCTNGIQNGRISKERLQDAVSTLDCSNLSCYICGPPPMIKDVTASLHEINVAENRIHFEKWW